VDESALVLSPSPAAIPVAERAPLLVAAPLTASGASRPASDGVRFRIVQQRSIAFAPPYPATPDVAVGFRELDVDRRANLRIVATATNVSPAGFTLSASTWADAVARRAEVAWHEIAAGDPDIQTGRFDTQEDHPWNVRQPETARRVSFRRAYAGAPCVLVWLHALDVANGANARVRAYATDVDEAGFTVHVDTWGDSTLYGVGVTWIAHPAGKPGIASGTFDTRDVRSGGEFGSRNSAAVAFPAGAFTAPPRVIAALTGLAVDRRADLRVAVSTDHVTAGGMTWHLDTWGDTLLYGAGAAYIAVGR
jgi:hypothetical protein